MGTLFWGKIDTTGKEGILRSMVSPKSSTYPEDVAASVGSSLQLLLQYLASEVAPLSQMQMSIGMCDHRHECDTTLPRQSIMKMLSSIGPPSDLATKFLGYWVRVSSPSKAKDDSLLGS
jgi:hypothetical protein